MVGISTHYKKSAPKELLKNIEELLLKYPIYNLKENFELNFPRLELTNFYFAPIIHLPLVLV